MANPLTWTKTYNTQAGDIYFKITYDQTWTSNTLDFDVIKELKFNYGYEDDDALTFYPNSVKLSFTDYNKKNYDILKLSIGEYANTFPANYETYSGVEIWRNNNLKFKGYIDPLTLEYKDKERVVSFEAVDRSRALKDISVELLDNMTCSLGELLHQIYKKVFPSLSNNVYDTKTFTNGMYLNHDWVFKGSDPLTLNTKTKTWATVSEFNQVFIQWNNGTNLWGADRPAATYKDLIKLLALQFGMSIGTLDYNKVYMIKRFNLANTNPTNVNNVLIGDYTRTLHLNVLQGVRNSNYFTTIGGSRVIYTAGSIEVINAELELRYPGLVKEFNTYIGQSGNVWNQTNIYIYEGGVAYYVHTYPATELGVYDPVIDYRGDISDVICQWIYQSRIRPKDRIECNLRGIDYNLIDFYSLTSDNHPTVTFRPMEMTKDYLENETSISGIEV